MSVPAYSEYRDSGVPWLARVPLHWNVHQTKRHFIRKKETNAGMICENRLALTMNGVLRRSLDDLDGLQSSDYEGYQLFEEGDLAFKLIDLQNIKTSRVGLVPERGIMSPAYIRLQPLGSTDVRFAYWYFMALYWTQVFNVLGGGVRQTLGPEELLTVEYPLPSLEEQTAIATFLDRETAKIDALIAEQEKLITLLAEKRQATISHAVTKGLSPAAQMKDSGVTWLGEIPAHWNIYKLRRRIIEHKQGYYSTDNYQDSGVRLLRITDLSSDGRASYDAAPFVANNADVEPFLLREYDFVFARTGGAGTFALVGPMAERVAYASYLIRFRFDGQVVPELLRYQFLSRNFELGIEHNIHGGVNKNIHAEDIKEQFVLVPPPIEQAEIVAFLDSETLRLDELTAEATRATDLLKERRTALISAAVTGKIDVRHLANQEAA